MGLCRFLLEVLELLLLLELLELLVLGQLEQRFIFWLLRNPQPSTPSPKS